MTTQQKALDQFTDMIQLAPISPECRHALRKIIASVAIDVNQPKSYLYAMAAALADCKRKELDLYDDDELANEKWFIDNGATVLDGVYAFGNVNTIYVACVKYGGISSIEICQLDRETDNLNVIKTAIGTSGQVRRLCEVFGITIPGRR